MLSTPVTLPCGAVVPGRIIKSAMSEGLSDEWSNSTPELCRLYKQWSQNHNAGHVLITGNVQIDRRYMEGPGNVAIELDCPDAGKRLELLKQWASAAQQDGTLCLVQLSHAGRQATTNVNLVSAGPSAIKADTLLPVSQPRALSPFEVEDVVNRFGNAARVCKEAGFAGIEIQAAHGYLISSFLSPRANHRQDKYGGSLEARSLLLFQVLDACRQAVGREFIIAVKLNASDFTEGGLSEEEAIQLALRLEREGVDLLDVSGGTHENPAMSAGPFGISKLRFGSSAPLTLPDGYFLPFAQRIKAQLKTLPVMVIGGFRSKQVMEHAISSGACDFIGVARPVCGDTECVAKLLRGEITELPRFENTLRLPFWLRWLDFVLVGQFLQLGASQVALLLNARRVAFGEQNLPPPSQWNILSDMMYLTGKIDEQAAALKGIDESVVGSKLHAKPAPPSALAKYAKIALVLAVFAAAAVKSKGLI